MAPTDGRRDALTTAIACVITAAWSASFLLEIAMTDYTPPASVTPLMLATAGYLFGGEVVKGVKKAGSDG